MSPEDARSDLLLAGAVFVFGPIVLTLLLSIFPIGRIPGAGSVLSLLVPALLTAAVPIALMRYRDEPWSALGFNAARVGLGSGAVLAAPVVVASVVPVLIAGGSPTLALPVLNVGSFGQLVGLGARLITWVGLAILATFAATKARDAFHSDFSSVPESIVRIGRILAIVVAIAGALRLIATGSLTSILLPLGVAATVYLVWKAAKGPSSIGLVVLLVPTVLLALGSFLISFSAARLIEGAWTGALVAGIGLAMAGVKESRGSAWPAVGMALVIALATTVPLPLRLGG